MRRCTIALCLLLAAPVFAQPQRTPEIPYRSVPNFLKLPAGIYLEAPVGVAVDSQGDLYVASRSRHPIMEFRPDGTYMRSVGDGLTSFDSPHSIRIGPQGNLWYVDVAANLIIEFSPQGSLLRVLGRKPDTWQARYGSRSLHPNPAWMFDGPTDLAFGPSGDIFVTDGYGNSRVAEFDHNGNYLKSWGERGAGPGQFHTPHSIVIDAKGMIYVADRANKRIEVFDSQGNFQKQWSLPDPAALCITPGPHQVIYSADGFGGRFYKLDLNGKILGQFGTFGKGLGQFMWVHGIACPSENVIYAAEEVNYRVQKLVLNPTR
ncbi:MAG: peptidyl-alpha-hydroxyglycine alpha-amidating lyase family protein [Terriglobia bacterium]